jgi:cytochrome c biogenesis protein CcmG/thiol:disulfide interchange protein DsbE
MFGRTATIKPLLILATALALAACGTQGGDYGGKHPDYAKKLAGSPKPLAAVHAQAGRLLSGGTEAYDRQIAALHGYPVVVNKWASWCGPCRIEAPHIQDAAAKFGKRIAFLGVNTQDSDAAAKRYMREYPLPYPSFSDPDSKIAAEMKAAVGFPSTAFYDRSGELVFTKFGQYRTVEELNADIARYAR